MKNGHTLKGKTKARGSLGGESAHTCWCDITGAKAEDWSRWNRFTFHLLLHCFLFLHITYNYPKLIYPVSHPIVIRLLVYCLCPHFSKGKGDMCSLLSLQKLSPASTRTWVCWRNECHADVTETGRKCQVQESGFTVLIWKLENDNRIKPGMWGDETQWCLWELSLVLLCKMNWSGGRTIRPAKRSLHYYRGQVHKPENGGKEHSEGKRESWMAK